MTTSPAASVAIGHVRAAAQLVSLPLSDSDATAVAALLSQWIPAATALSTRMQSADLDGLAPITAFVTPDALCPVHPSLEGSAP